MEKNIKNKIITYGFVLILLLFFAINICIEDKLISQAERRDLELFPKITIDGILNGNINEKLEKYTTDQMVFRDEFRSIKTYCKINIFRQKDNNGLFVKDDAIYKIEYPLKENNVIKSFEKMNKIYNEYLQNMNVYYTVIPDKSYYLSDEYLKLDFDKIIALAENTLNNMKYIDISRSLDISDYYITDLHWKQEALFDVVNNIEEIMGLDKTTIDNYTLKGIGDFYGAYYGQLGMKMFPDRMYVLTNDIIEGCITYNYERNKFGRVYDYTETLDKYDIYLSGATPLIVIDNPKSVYNKELIIFRDSFGSSIAPLLIHNYSKIIMVDLRYMASGILDKYINFNNQDVLFIYSSLILNQNVLK